MTSSAVMLAVTGRGGSGGVMTSVVESPVSRVLVVGVRSVVVFARVVVGIGRFLLGGLG
jgi:hypothetical protein